VSSPKSQNSHTASQCTVFSRGSAGAVHTPHALLHVSLCPQVGAAEGVTAQLEEVASQLSAYKTKLAAAQEEVRAMLPCAEAPACAK
jgi:hypothetical protein